MSLISSFKNKIKALLLYPATEPTSSAWVTPMWRLERLGSLYGGWTIPVEIFDRSSICYCIGAGEDITFDLELIRRFGSQIFSYDPTPRAATHVQSLAANLGQYHFFPVGIWDENRIMRFYAPSNSAHVSHSIVNLQATDNYFEAQCTVLSTAFRENGHSYADLVKLDVEGAEYQILRSIIRDNLHIRVLCIEFDELHHPLDADYKSRIRKMIEELLEFGYQLIRVEGSNYTFIKTSDFPLVARLAKWFWTSMGFRKGFSLKLA
jgi:FkbM family methyltransferase